MEKLEFIYEFISNKYFIFSCAILTFLLPLFLKLRIFIEERIILYKERKIIIPSNKKNIEQERFDLLNMLSIEWKHINVYTNIAVGKDLFDEDGIPNYDYSVFEQSISLTQYNHLIELYNRSLFSGFWSLFLPYIKRDTSEAKVHLGKENVYIKKIEHDVYRYFIFQNLAKLSQ